jgi:hypothetical protein
MHSYRILTLATVPVGISPAEFHFAETAHNARSNSIGSVDGPVIPTIGRHGAGPVGRIRGIGEHAADRLDPVSGRSHLVDESADQRWRGSSSRAKKIEAECRWP